MHRAGKGALRAQAASYSFVSVKTACPTIATVFGRALLGCCALVVAMSPSAKATTLGPGTTLFPAPSEPGQPLGGLALASAPADFSSVPDFSGTLMSTVISGDTTNPYGGLTFTYLLSNDEKSDHPISRLTVNGFTGFQIDASYNPDDNPGGTRRAPTLINRPDVPDGDYVGFSFIDGAGPGALQPGMTSLLLVLQTNAKEYTRSFAAVINGSAATDVATYAPVPEPSTLLALGGLTAAALLRRRR